MLKVREMVSADVESVSQIIRSKPTMYGVNIVELHDLFISNFTGRNDSKHACVLENDGEIVGAICQYYWPNLPFWSLGSMFLKSELHNKETLRMIHSIFDYAAARAEIDRRFDFYYITRDTGRLRFDWVFKDSEFTEKYEISDVEILEPSKISEYSAIRVLMGELSGKQQKTLVVRHGHLKNGFRK